MAEKIWVGIYSDPMASRMVSDLKYEGIKARRGHSIYVGHGAVEVLASNKEDLRKAASVLKKYGWINDIGWTVDWAMDQLHELRRYKL